MGTSIKTTITIMVGDRYTYGVIFSRNLQFFLTPPLIAVSDKPVCPLAPRGYYRN
jgi:hypothetical protein